ncbi:sam dependent methyltransferase [Diplodia corticola]|uniref:Sam dependent methyltransferase n=1 Tax=Diplodia corticola TaxID=236234 RepID=A0A1J9RPA9_9PEZI|nr:sam dependent methyltransferase [Diplodia corticola]OJD29405.1 sam dependent methyltransferase [Diplodia corticola]
MADDDNDDTPHAGCDSGIEDGDDDDLASETTSVHSSIYRYRFENGRRYHAYRDGEYWGPNDEKAQDHLDIAHNLWLKTLDGKLFLAPLPAEIGKVLDVGCGTGIWAIDLADAHPTADVTGTDLSPTQPSWVPPNCRFEVDDAADTPWTWRSGTFDFIHVRSLFGCVGDWRAFYAEARRCLKPGGYIEHVEMGRRFKGAGEDGSGLPADSALAQLDGLGEEACRRIGKPGDVVYRMKGWLEEGGGWEDVTQVEYRWPTGPWARDARMKELGRWSRLHLLEGVENWTLAMLTRVLGYSFEEAQVWIAKIKADVRDPAVRAYHDMYVCYARKPEEGGS